MRRQNIILFFNLFTSIVFIIAIIWLTKEINNLKIQNLKLELLLMSGKQDYSQSFVIFQRLKNLSGDILQNETGDNEKILLEAKYEAVILNSTYNVFPDFHNQKNFLQRFIRFIDEKLNPSLYQKIEDRRVYSEKYMELAFFMEINKNYEDAIRYYTMFLAKNNNKNHDYYNIAMLHLAFCYLLNGYLDYTDSLIREINSFCRNKIIIKTAEMFLDYITKMRLKYRYHQVEEIKTSSLESGLRNYSVFNYNKAIYNLSNYLLMKNSRSQGDTLKAFYFIARSYEETGRFDRAIEFYRYILLSKYDNPYRERVIKRIILLHYVYKVPIAGINKIISENMINIDAGLMNELNDISIISRELPRNRKKMKGDALKVEDEDNIKKFLQEKDSSNELILQFFSKFDTEAMERLKKDDEVKKEIIGTSSIAGMLKDRLGKENNKPGTTPQKIKVYLKNDSELIGYLILLEKDFLRIKVFGSKIDIKTEEIKRWEYLK